MIGRARVYRMDGAPFLSTFSSNEKGEQENCLLRVSFQFFPPVLPFANIYKFDIKFNAQRCCQCKNTKPLKKKECLGIE